MLSPVHQKSLSNVTHSSCTRLMCHPCRDKNISAASTAEIQLPFRRPKLIKPLSYGNSWRKKLSNNKIITLPVNTTSTILRLMDGLDLPMSSEIYTCLIKECTVKKDSARALELHQHIQKSKIRPTSSLWLNRLILMLVKCAQLDTARHLFDEMPVKDLNSWAIVIVAYIDIDDYQESIMLFVEMMRQLKSSHMLLEFPAWIIVCIFKACVCTMNMEFGKQVHGLLLKLGCSNNVRFTGSLINFYGKFGFLEDANVVFDQLTQHNTVVWTAKIVNSCREGRFHEVFDDFKEMGREGIKKNNYTYSSVLKACHMVNDNCKCGKQVHANAIKIGLESDLYVQSGLVNMYGKYGLLRDAERVFELIGNNNNIAAWNAMLMGYVRNGFPVEAVKFLYQMKAAGVPIQDSLIKDVRMACGNDGIMLENRTEQRDTMCK